MIYILFDLLKKLDYFFRVTGFFSFIINFLSHLHVSGKLMHFMPFESFSNDSLLIVKRLVVLDRP